MAGLGSGVCRYTVRGQWGMPLGRQAPELQTEPGTPTLHVRCSSIKRLGPCLEPSQAPHSAPTATLQGGCCSSRVQRRGPREVEYPTHSHTAPPRHRQAPKPDGSRVPVLTTELWVLPTHQASLETGIASGTVSGSGTLGRAGLKPHPHLPPTPRADSGQMPRVSLPRPGALWPPRWSCPVCPGSGRSPGPERTLLAA